MVRGVVALLLLWCLLLCFPTTGADVEFCTHCKVCERNGWNYALCRADRDLCQVQCFRQPADSSVTISEDGDVSVDPIMSTAVFLLLATLVWSFWGLWQRWEHRQEAVKPLVLWSQIGVDLKSGNGLPSLLQLDEVATSLRASVEHVSVSELKQLNHLRLVLPVAVALRQCLSSNESDWPNESSPVLLPEVLKKKMGDSVLDELLQQVRDLMTSTLPHDGTDKEELRRLDRRFRILGQESPYLQHLERKVEQCKDVLALEDQTLEIFQLCAGNSEPLLLEDTVECIDMDDDSTEPEIAKLPLAKGARFSSSLPGSNAELVNPVQGVATQLEYANRLRELSLYKQHADHRESLAVAQKLAEKEWVKRQELHESSQERARIRHAAKLEKMQQMLSHREQESRRKWRTRVGGYVSAAMGGIAALICIYRSLDMLGSCYAVLMKETFLTPQIQIPCYVGYITTAFFALTALSCVPAAYASVAKLFACGVIVYRYPFILWQAVAIGFASAAPPMITLLLSENQRRWINALLVGATISICLCFADLVIY